MTLIPRKSDLYMALTRFEKLGDDPDRLLNALSYLFSMLLQNRSLPSPSDMG
ncbi:Hypothetical predicted protein, partial [Pelobates cultripes]